MSNNCQSLSHCQCGWYQTSPCDVWSQDEKNLGRKLSSILLGAGRGLIPSGPEWGRQNGRKPKRVKRWNHRWKSCLKGWKWLRFSSPTNQTLMNWHKLVYQLKNSIIYFPIWSKPWSFRGLLATSREAHLAAKGRFSCELPGLLQRAALEVGDYGSGRWKSPGEMSLDLTCRWKKRFYKWDVQMKIVSSKSGVACRLMSL